MDQPAEALRPPRPDWAEGRGRITTIDAHAAGEPFRVVVSGAPTPRGEDQLARRRWARRHLERLRTGLMWEPRGHADMYGCLVTPPATPDAHFGVLFLHNEGYSTMCGHGILALVTVVLETGMWPASEPRTVLRIDTPAGLVTARATVDGGRVRAVSFVNVPSFVLALDQTLPVPGLGPVSYDLAFGGAFYAYVDAAELGLGCRPGDLPSLIGTAAAIKGELAARRPVVHPVEPDLAFLYGVVFVAPAESPEAHSRNVCVFADGEVDRSPTGTSVSARLAIGHARGEVGIDEPLEFESVLGTRFGGRIVGTTRVGDLPAVLPEVSGSAHLTGCHEFLFDPEDPLRDGFFLRSGEGPA